MVYGAIDKKGEEFYTFLPKLFDAIDNAQLDYNWLITACDCNCQNKIEDEYRKQGYCWISGKELTETVNETEIQWIWAVLSGFRKDISLDDVLKHPYPDADGYPEFWHNPLSMQHPLSTIEIVPWDSSLTLFFSTDKGLVDKFRAGYPYSEDLFVHNSNLRSHKKQENFNEGTPKSI